MVRGLSDVYEGSTENIARTFLSETPDLFGLGGRGTQDLVLDRVREHRGVSHVRFQQTYQGLPVEGAVYLVHIREDGRVDMANGTLYSGVSAPTTPRVPAAKATASMLEDRAGALVQDAPQLVVYPQARTEFALAWKVSLTRDLPPDEWVGFVDAQTGEVLEVRDLSSTSSASLPLREPSIPFTSGLGKVYLTHPGISSATPTVTLPRLDGSGYLRGTYADIYRNEELSSSPQRAYDAASEFFYGPTHDSFREVNVYYHIDRFRSLYVNGLGGGLGFTQIDARVGAAFLNARFIQGSFSLDFGTGKNIDGSQHPDYNDFALEDKVAYHEYMHAVEHDLAGVVGGSNQSGAIDEGQADYFAGSFTGRSTFLDYAHPLGTRDMAAPAISSYSAYLAEGTVASHRGGEFFSSILWDARTAIGQPDADGMAYGALFRISPTPDFAEFREAMLAEGFLYGDPSACGVAAAFHGRGIGTALLTDISGPASLDKLQSGTWTARTPCTTGSHSYQWKRRYLNSSTWSTVGTASTYSQTMGNDGFDLAVRVTRAGEVVHDTLTVVRCTSCGSTGPRIATEAPDEEERLSPVVEAIYPNPVRGAATLRFMLPESTPVDLTVVDALGRRQPAPEAEGLLKAGVHTRTLDTTEWASGVYQLRLRVGSEVFVQPFTVVR